MQSTEKDPATIWQMTFIFSVNVQKWLCLLLLRLHWNAFVAIVEGENETARNIYRMR